MIEEVDMPKDYEELCRLQTAARWLRCSVPDLMKLLNSPFPTHAELIDRACEAAAYETTKAAEPDPSHNHFHYHAPEGSRIGSRVTALKPSLFKRLAGLLRRFAD